MNIKDFYIAPIKGYQYISKMLPANCRYYPTCSEYAKWQFEFNAPHKALLASSLRILRCNQLFDGGIDYPVVTYVPPKLMSLLDFNRHCGKIKIIYWFVPTRGLTSGDMSQGDLSSVGLIPNNNNKYYILKDFDAINDSSGS